MRATLRRITAEIEVNLATLDERCYVQLRPIMREGAAKDDKSIAELTDAVLRLVALINTHRHLLDRDDRTFLDYGLARMAGFSDAEALDFMAEAEDLMEP
jgi:hypothetical protein